MTLYYIKCDLESGYTITIIIIIIIIIYLFIYLLAFWTFFPFLSDLIRLVKKKKNQSINQSINK